MSSLESSIGGGFSKLWDGTKDIVSGTYEVISAPFRSSKEEDKKSTTDIKSKDNKKESKKSNH
jgi:hypothetical protein